MAENSENRSDNTFPEKRGRYYGDGGLYRNVKVPVRVVEYVIVALIVILIGCVVFGALNGGYTVTFDARGGTPVASVKLSYGDPLPEPPPPTMEGHTFLGWFADEGLTRPWDFSQDTIYGSMTLYAGWSE